MSSVTNNAIAISLTLLPNRPEYSPVATLHAEKA